MRYRPETNSLKWSYFSVRRLREKGWRLIGDAGTSVQNETDDLWLTGSIVGVLRWICICCHSDFTQLNLYSSLSDGAELGGGGLMRWNTCKCLLFEEQHSLGTPPSPTPHSVCAHTCVVQAGSESLQERFHLFSFQFGEVAIIILVEVSTFF